MIWLETMLVALSTYTALPMPQFEWNEKNMRYAICGLPLAGVICGAALLLWTWLACRFHLPAVLYAVVAVALPLLLTGGIHMDGYMDTVDALASHQNRERMLEIMKDSHIGTFGVVAAILDLGFKYILILETGMPVLMLIAGPVAGKMVQGLCMYKTVYPRENGLGKSYIGRIPAKIMVFGAVLGGVITAACMYGGSRNGIRALVLPIGCLIFAYIVKKRMVHVIGGMTGDTLGAASEMTEIFCMILILVLEGV